MGRADNVNCKNQEEAGEKVRKRDRNGGHWALV